MHISTIFSMRFETVGLDNQQHCIRYNARRWEVNLIGECVECFFLLFPRKSLHIVHSCVKDERFSAIRCRLYNCRGCLTSCRIFIPNWLDVSLAIRKKNVLFIPCARHEWGTGDAERWNWHRVFSVLLHSWRSFSHPQTPYWQRRISFLCSEALKLNF